MPEARASALEALLEEVWGKSDDPEHFNAGLGFVVTSARRAEQTATMTETEAGFGGYPQGHRVFRRRREESPGDYRRALLWS